LMYSFQRTQRGILPLSLTHNNVFPMSTSLYNNSSYSIIPETLAHLHKQITIALVE